MKNTRYLAVVFVILTMIFSTVEAQKLNTEKFTGYKTLFHNNGELHIAQKFINNIIVQKEEYYQNGSLKERIHVLDRVEKWLAILYYEDRSVLAECYLLKGKLHGKYKKYFQSGQLSYVVNYINGLREGLYQYYYLNGNKVADVYYRAGKKNGTYIGFHEDGSLLITGTYFEDKRHGEFVMYPKDNNGNSLPEKRSYHYHGDDITKEQYLRYKIEDKDYN